MVTLKKKCCCGGCSCPCTTGIKFSYLITPITSVDPDGCPVCEDFKAINIEPYSSDTDGSMYGCLRWDSGCMWQLESPAGSGVPLSNFGPYNCGDTTTPNPTIALNLAVDPDCIHYFTINFPAGQVTYALDGTFDCEASNTFTLEDGDPGIIGNCQLPTTITIEPTDQCGPCDTCTDYPASLTFTLGAVAGGGTCNDLDGDFCLCPIYADCQFWGGYNADGMYAEIWFEGPYVSGFTAGRSLIPSQPIFFSTGYYVLWIPFLGVYQADAADFDCAGDTVFTLVSGGGDCTAPATITVTASATECAGGCDRPPPPPTDCLCTPKSDYSPRVRVSGIVNGTCDDCSCIPDLELCFEPYGVDDEDCLWIAEFTLPSGDPIGCSTNATYALLDMAQAGQSITFYDSSDVSLATFSASSADCDASGYTFWFAGQNLSETCDWSDATCTLDMHGSACPSCAPCSPTSMIGTPPQAIKVDIQYDGHFYTFCVVDVTDCTATSVPLGVSGGGGDQIYVVVEFGASPASYVRLLVYYDPAVGAAQLIGVYNYLADISTFDCSDANELDLATGNAGQCGADIDVGGYTSLLAASASVTGLENCVVCNESVMPSSLTATFTDNTGNCCDTGLTGTLTQISPTQWSGTITGCSSGETVNINLEQTGADCSDFRMTMDYSNGCDPGVTNRAPYSCTCGDLRFKVTGSVFVFEDEIRVTW